MSNVFSPQGANASTTLPKGGDVQRYGTGIETFVKNASGSGRGDGTVLDAAFFNRIIGNLNYVVEKSNIDAKPGDLTALYRAITGINSASYLAIDRKINAGKGLSGGGDLKTNPTLKLDISTLDAHAGAIDGANDKVAIYDASTKKNESVSADALADFVNGKIAAADDATDGADKFPVLKTPSTFKLLSLPYVDLKGHRGAVIGGHGGPWAWLQEAIWEGQSSNRPIYATPGVYDFTDEAENVAPGIGNVKIYGDYGHTIFKIFEGTDVDPLSLFYDVEAGSKGFMFFEGLTFQGTFGQDGRTAQTGGVTVWLDHYNDVKFSYCKWMNCTSGATDLHFNVEASADHCTMIDLCGDGFRTRETKYVSATNNYFQRIGDDSISNHGGKYFPDYDPHDGTPRREGFVATGNIFRDVSACITNLAGRQSVVENNIANRFRNYFYYCSQSSQEGENPSANIKVANNIGLNLMTGIGAYVIISGVAPRGATVTSGVIPGQPHSDGSFEYSYDWQNADALDTNDAFPPMENIDVSGNIFARTLPAVAKYSDWGFGTRGSKTYADDPAVTDADFRLPAGLNITIGKKTTIRNNIIESTTDGIFLINQSGITPAMVGGAISGNIVRDFTSRGIVLSGVSGKLIELTVGANTIDGDVYRQASNSNLDGTYDVGSGNPTAIDLGSSYGANVHDNIISNVARAMITPENHNCRNNTIIADIAGLGDNASNKGVRNLPSVEYGFRYIHAYCDPTDNTHYGTIKNVMVNAASAMPTTGFYVKGHFVKNDSKILSVRDVLMGWLRLTTNSNHALDTDWAEVYAHARPILGNVANITPGTIANGATYPAAGVPGTISVTGAAVGAKVIMTYQADRKGVILDGWVSAADTVSYLFTNMTGASQSLSAASVRARVENI